MRASKAERSDCTVMCTGCGRRHTTLCGNTLEGNTGQDVVFMWYQGSSCVVLGIVGGWLPTCGCARHDSRLLQGQDV